MHLVDLPRSAKKIQLRITDAKMNLGSEIITNLNSRLDSLLTPTKAAVFMDPRLCDILSIDDKRIAIG